MGTTSPPLRTAALRLDPQLVEQLKKSPLGLSEEARRRIERTFIEDEIDPRTREITAALIRLADAVEQHVGAEWHAHPRAFDVFTAAVSSRLASYRPSATRTDANLEIDEADDASTIGRMLDRDDRRLRVIEGDKPPSELQEQELSSEQRTSLEEMLRRLVQKLHEQDGTGDAGNLPVETVEKARKALDKIDRGLFGHLKDNLKAAKS